METNNDSAEPAQEETPEGKLAVAHERLFQIILITCLGSVVLMLGPLFHLKGGWVLLSLLFGMIILASPALIMYHKYGIWALFKFRQYEVITTWSDGTRTSDHGAESNMNFPLQLALYFILIYVGCFYTMAVLYYRIMRYIVLYLKCATRPPVMKSGFLLMAIGAAVPIVLTLIIKLTS